MRNILDDNEKGELKNVDSSRKKKKNMATLIIMKTTLILMKMNC